MSGTQSAETLTLLEDLAKQAKQLGASDFAFAHNASDSRSVSVRHGAVESIEGGSPQKVSIEVYFGRKTGSASTDSLRPGDLQEALRRAAALAKISSQDKNKAITDPDDIARSFPDLELHDPYTPDTDTLIRIATTVEAAALAYPKIVNSSGGHAGHTRNIFTMVASNGFSAQEISSQNYFYTSVIAGNAKGMETDSAQSFALWGEDMETPEAVGTLAAERAATRLDSIKMHTALLPVIFSPRVSGKLAGMFASAIAGNKVFKKLTFLSDKLGQRIFPEGINIVDNPLVVRGLGSGTFDQDGVARRPLLLVEDGILQTWITSVESARKLKLRSTGHASGTGNMHLSAGKISPADLISDIREGLYVTSLMGSSANTMTGEYSSGAAGFLISNGKITDQAVSEVTIGGTLADMFRHVQIANDLDLNDFKRKSQTLAPTLRFDTLTIGGK